MLTSWPSSAPLTKAARASTALMALGCAPSATRRSIATSELCTRIFKPADIAGLKIRVQSSLVAIDLLVALGAQPSAMSAVDARAAFVSGALDGQEVSIAA